MVHSSFQGLAYFSRICKLTNVTKWVQTSYTTHKDRFHYYVFPQKHVLYDVLATWIHSTRNSPSKICKNQILNNQESHYVFLAQSEVFILVLLFPHFKCLSKTSQFPFKQKIWRCFIKPLYASPELRVIRHTNNGMMEIGYK